MADSILFFYRNSPVRVVKTNAGYLFGIRDICNILGLSNPNRELSKYTENVPQYERIRTPGGLQVVRLVPFSDVEKLLCDVPGKRATVLLNWLRREVCPALKSISNDANARQPPWEHNKKHKTRKSTPEHQAACELLCGHLALMQMLMSVPIEQQPLVFLGFTDEEELSNTKRLRKHDR